MTDPREIVTQERYAWVLTTHAGARYLLTVPDVDRECCSDIDVAALRVTAAQVRAWLGEMDLAQQLATVHGVEAIVFRAGESGPSYLAAASSGLDEETFDAEAPDWNAEARVDLERRHVRPGAVWWEATHHYGDLPISTPWFDRAELEALGRYLAAEEAA